MPIRRCETCHKDFTPERDDADKCLPCTMSYYMDMVHILDQVEARDLVEQLTEVVIWMSGSSDFTPEGQAHEGWRTRGHPTLQRALDFLKKTIPPPRPPSPPAAPRFDREEPL